MKSTQIAVSGILFFLIAFSWEPALCRDSGLDSVEERRDTYGSQLGTVQFNPSCNKAASQHVKQGLALLHHMTYGGARAAFVDGAEADPDCAMSYWGQAMTFIHPLWSDPPSEAEFRKGAGLVEKARVRGQKNDLEIAFIDAVGAYYDAGHEGSERVNLSKFEQGWEKVYQTFQEDPEAASFYALAHLATADPGDKSYVRQKRTTEIAQKVLDMIPDHPGAHHYIIHANDYPSLAQGALEVARSYGEIAPRIPHALHMPSHIFTRLGLWSESIAMNKRSAAAALQHPADGMVSLHYPHALDYLAYAYLQRAEDDKAKEVLETVREKKGPFQPHVAAAYTFAAVPARYALERQQWFEVGDLEPRMPGDYPWEKFPAMEAITHFARALGMARSGDGQAARRELETLALLRGKAAEQSAYWAKQVGIQLLSARAWLMYEEGLKKEGLAIMKEATAMEASTEKHPVTPGEILPAHELLADMLLDMGRFQEAQVKYRAALERSPNRFNSLYGAGRAAELAGDNEKAAFYYRKLLAITAPGAKRRQVKKARTFLAEN